MGTEKIANDGERNKCAWRLSLLFIFHELEKLEPASRGPAVTNWKTRATQTLADETGYTTEHITALRRKASKYLTVAETFGPGMLLILGCDTAKLYV